MDPAGGAEQLSARRSSALAFLALAVAGGLLGFWRAPFFKADDFAVIEYASHGEHVLADFTGAQYGLTFFFRFWRPLITLSLAVDHWFFGAHPFGYHLDTMLAHVLVGWLLFCILRRLQTAPLLAGLGAMVFLLSPVTQLSSVWVVGRVDVHAAVWLLLGALLHLRAPTDRVPLWPLLPFVLALATKETGIAFPLLVVGLDLLAGRRRSWLHYLPGFVLAGLYLGWRTFLFGTPLGGYAIQSGIVTATQVPEALAGLARAALVLLAPSGSWFWRMVGIGALLAAGAMLWQRGLQSWRAPAGAMLLLAATLGPLLPFFQGQSDVWSMRYFYLAVAAVVALLTAAAGRAWVMGGLAVAMLAGSQPVTQIGEWESDNRWTLGNIAIFGEHIPAGTPVLLDGTREQIVHPYRLLWGVDRLHAPPFATSFRRILVLHPLHPLAPRPEAARWPILACRRAPAAPHVVDLQAYDPLGYWNSGPPVPAPRRVPDLTQPITGALLRDITESRTSPGFPTSAASGTNASVLFLTAQGIAELPVTVGPDGKVSLKDVLTAPVTPGLPLLSLLVNCLDMELSPHFYLCLSTRPQELLEIEFDRSALPFLLQLLR